MKVYSDETGWPCTSGNQLKDCFCVGGSNCDDITCPLVKEMAWEYLCKSAREKWTRAGNMPSDWGSKKESIDPHTKLHTNHIDLEM